MTTRETKTNGMIPLTLIWSDREGQYLGSQGEEEVVLTWTELRELIENGRSDERGVVTSIVLWLPVAVNAARDAQRSQATGTEQ